MDLTELTSVQSFDSTTQARRVLEFVRWHFAQNELTSTQWRILEDVADATKGKRLSKFFSEQFYLEFHEILTFRLAQSIEYDRDNDAFLQVTRYLELHPLLRQIRMLKTVRLVPDSQPIDAYLKRHSAFVKLE
ncbi:unnamed protein product [Caenorhabditis bovis]|uniref:Uncharacterized protein n=1 Tax=Caenorhabditis bovis TaxID=2654633 RepID=A0A8S1EL16_9PELO|nr:unnamed protein product [Caenorhabditis bovis]